jgi:hypothetical protein
MEASYMMIPSKTGSLELRESAYCYVDREKIHFPAGALDVTNCKRTNLPIDQFTGALSVLDIPYVQSLQQAVRGLY